MKWVNQGGDWVQFVRLAMYRKSRTGSMQLAIKCALVIPSGGFVCRDLDF